MSTHSIDYEWYIRLEYAIAVHRTGVYVIATVLIASVLS
jgi:hypothetical protein